MLAVETIGTNVIFVLDDFFKTLCVQFAKFWNENYPMEHYCTADPANILSNFKDYSNSLHIMRNAFCDKFKGQNDMKYLNFLKNILLRCSSKFTTVLITKFVASISFRNFLQLFELNFNLIFDIRNSSSVDNNICAALKAKRIIDLKPVIVFEESNNDAEQLTKKFKILGFDHVKIFILQDLFKTNNISVFNTLV